MAQTASIEKGIEHRRETRVKLDCAVSVFDRETSDYIGLMVNVSSQGLMITSSKELKMDHVYQFALTKHPEHRQVSAMPVFIARSVWSSPVGEHFFNTGFEMLDSTFAARELMGVAGWIE